MTAPSDTALLDTLIARRVVLTDRRARLSWRADVAHEVSAALRAENSRGLTEAARLRGECERLLAEAACRLAPLSSADVGPTARAHDGPPPAASGAPRGGAAARR
ncbi:hypothetical protein rosag_03080 [Roseisolibacter agri]|uniref:Uncharacterized protein n=1 Tax=Roseisolibacter agri TaxID=2014610 RepID=A0AA37PZE6_9BACT|nr:hypothetical protein rosag_03080 [Roseisolibacter agri]